jgi:hypothetical protein
MAGLDIIKGYADSESVEPTTDTQETTAAPLTKAVASKGPYALPTPTGLAGVDPNLLERMQQMINEREAQRGSFSEAMRDAQAWWSGGAAGPSEALARRAAEKEAQAATTFGMRRDLAQYKMAQQNAQNLQRAISGQPGTATTTTQTPQSVAGVAPQAGGAGAPTTPAQQPNGGLLDLIKDPGLKQSIAIQATQDPNKALTSIQTYLAKNAEDPQMIKDLNAMIRMGLIDPKLVPAAVLTKFVGSGAFVPHDVRGVGGTSQSTPFGSAQALSPQGGAPAAAPSAPAAAPRNVLAPTPGPAAPVPAAPAAAPVSPSAAATTPVAAPKPVVSAPVATAAPVAAAAPAALIKPPMQAPLVSPTLQTGFAPGSKEDLEAKAEAAKQKISAQIEQQKPIQKGAGESAVALTNAASNAKQNITEYDMAENILKKYPKAFGIGQDGSATAAVIQLVKPGTTIPILGTVKSEGIEEAVAQKSLPKKAIEARNIFNSIATRQGVEYAKNNLTGEGRGTLSNADMKMANVAKGLSTDSPAAANLIFTVLNRENEMMIMQRNNAWEKYQQDAEKAGVTPDFNAFRQSEAYKKPMEEKDARVRKRFPEFFKGDETQATPKTSGNKVYNPKTGKVE